MFDKSVETFPVKQQYVNLAYCSVSPLYGGALNREIEVSREQHESGIGILSLYQPILTSLHASAARLLGTSPDNVAVVKNASEGIGLIAGGYPFRPGDQVVSYVHEYPANHYPWRLQERRGVELRLLPNRDPTGEAPADRPAAWSMDDLQQTVTDRTRVIAISHVQFASGFAADLRELAAFCRERDVDLVIDAAQSLGCLPIYPDDLGIAAVVASGWKWLMGPVGVGLLYTSGALRAKLEPVLSGAGMMRQGVDYLNHDWDPHESSLRFEYSTVPVSLAAGLDACLRDLFLTYGIEAIWSEVGRLQDRFLDQLDRRQFRPLEFARPHRSGILALSCDDARAVSHRLRARQVICTERGGMLRIAPHFHTTDEEIDIAVAALNG